MRRPPLAAALSVIILAPLPLTANPASPSRIVDVTVFPDRAEVAREIRVDLPAGSSRVEFPALPWGLEPDSLRVTARGVAASLGTIDLEEEARPPVETPDQLSAREEVRRLESALAALEIEEATDTELRGFIAALKASTAARESEKLAAGKADPGAVQAIYTFVRSGMQDLGKEKIERTERRVALGRDLEVARARLAAVRPAGAIRSRTARVEVETQRAGALTIRLTYLTPAVSWRPSYRATLEPGGGDLLLDAEGVVRQSTGEDWSGVALRLSTAAPARGVRPPMLAALLLRPLEIGSIDLLQGKMKRAASEVVSGGFARNLAIAPGLSDGDGNDPAAPAEVPAARPEAALVHTSYNVAFEVTGRPEIPSDGLEHRVLLRTEKLAARTEYRTVPTLSEAAFLVAKSTAPGGYPLLAGPVRVFAGSAYLGSFQLEETGPGADLTIPFGVDNRITINRTPLPQSRSEQGLIGKDRRVAYSFTTTLENRLDRAATVILEDRVPVSGDERVEVDTDRTTTPGARPVQDRPGVLEWSVTLEPRQKKEIVLAYAVRFPKELVVPGVE